MAINAIRPMIFCMLPLNELCAEKPTWGFGKRTTVAPKTSRWADAEMCDDDLHEM